MSTTCSNQNEPVPFEKTPQYLEIQHKQWHQKLKQAGVRGIYEKAESKEGKACFERYKKHKGSYLYGQPGRGKTWAAAACVILVLKAGGTAKIIRASALLQEVYNTITRHGETSYEKYESYDLLVLDDLGMEHKTEKSMEIILSILDTREALRKPTIITSNYSLGELRRRWGEMQGARLVSRLGGSCARVEFVGQDRRLVGIEDAYQCEDV